MGKENELFTEEEQTKEIVIMENPVMQIDAQALIEKAIEKETPIEVMERLLVMRRELKEEAAKDAYFQALANFQMDCPVIEKTAPVYDKAGKLRYKFAPIEKIIEQVKPYLIKYGFSYTIKTKNTDIAVTAYCNIHHRSGHKEIDEDGVTIPIDEKAYMNIAQKVASALSFAKRYAFCDAFGIITGDGDDDGNYSGDPDQQKTKEKLGNQGITYTEAPEENKALYSGIMALIREKYLNHDLFTPQEREENKKKADAVLGNYEALKALYSGVKKVAEDRRAMIKEERK